MRLLLLASALTLMSCNPAPQAPASTAAEPTSSVAESTLVSYNEPYRPQFHFTPTSNWMNDPNGLVYHDGEYHLFYQHNPFGDRWGHMSWGHAVSTDLVHWQHLPVAIPEDEQAMIFSGGAVVDKNNTSGFGSADQVPMVAIYTGAKFENPDSDQRVLLNQAQYLAYSLDNGRNWEKYANNPVLDLGLKEFRDPKVFWHDDSWLMVIALSDQRKVSFYRSPDLKQWTHLSDFGPAGSVEGLWECPDLFLLPVQGSSEQRWVLQVDVNEGAPAGGSGSQYFIGNFDGEQFVLDANQHADDETKWVDYGQDFFATVSWENVPEQDGRRMWVGWHNNWHYAQDIPTAPWRSAQTVPRQLGLAHIDGQLRLTQWPIRELEQLRQAKTDIRGQTLSDAALQLEGAQSGSYDLQLTLDLQQATGVELALLANAEHQTRLGYDRDSQTLYLDRSNSGDWQHPKFNGRMQAPLIVADGRLQLRVLVDQSSIEVFADQGQRVLTARVFPPADANQLRLATLGGNALVEQLSLWPMASIWPAPTPE